MKVRSLRLAGLCLTLCAMVLLGACHKKSAPVVPSQAPPPPPPASPTATLAVSPSSVQAGQAVQISWSTNNATSVNIAPLGAVSLNGSQSVTPQVSTTYTLTAKGAGGEVQQSARVTVTAPPAPVAAGPSDEEVFASHIKDIYFNYDRFDIRAPDEPALKADADLLAAHAGWKILIAGHCDERGSEEYNLALGASRANSVRNALVKMGVSAERMQTTSFGKEKPFCREQKEECWQQNRRAHYRLAK